MNFNQDFQRPNSGIGHPGMDAPFGTYPTSDGWVTIAMSPFKTLVKVLGDDSLLKYDDPAILFDQRDIIWNEIAKRTQAFDTHTLMSMMLAEDIWCGEVKSHLEAADDPQVKHLGLIQEYQHSVAGSVKCVYQPYPCRKPNPPFSVPLPPLVNTPKRYWLNLGLQIKKLQMRWLLGSLLNQVKIQQTGVLVL